jgi:hypothetical protein
MKQHTTTAGMYAQDYEGIFPQLVHPGGRTDLRERLYWYAVLAPYVKNWQIFVCPSCESDIRFTGNGKSRVPVEEGAYILSLCHEGWG